LIVRDTVSNQNDFKGFEGAHKNWENSAEWALKIETPRQSVLALLWRRSSLFPTGKSKHCAIDAR
jgi:hypothetical protein